VLISGETGLLPSNAVLARVQPHGGLAPGRGSLALAAVDEASLLPDIAPVNSWSVRGGELDAAEVLETQLVGQVRPRHRLDATVAVPPQTGRPGRDDP
jgi:hypothetical protein